MIGGGVVEAFLGVKAEGQSLENIAKPLTAEDGAGGPRDAARLTLGDVRAGRPCALTLAGGGG